MSERTSDKLGSMPVGKLIANMAMPAIIAMVIQALYNIVDSIYVAQISEQALLSVSLAYPMQLLIIAVMVGTGIGLNSLIARKLGQQEPEVAGEVATHGLVLATINGFIFLLIAMFLAKPFLNAFTSDAQVLNGAITYSRIALGLSVFCMVSTAIEKSIQATGNMVLPMVQLIVGAVTNIILDPILIFGMFGMPAMGVKGAAIATIIGQFCSMLIGFYGLFKLKLPYKINFKGFKLKLEMVKEIYKVGVPSIIMNAIVAAMITGMNAILTPMSDTAVSVLNIYFKVQSFVFMPVYGLTQGAMPVIGYNYGAGNKQRIIEAYKVTVRSAFFIMLAGTILFWVIPDKILMLFNAGDDMMSMGISALNIISLSFVGAAVGIVNAVTFQAVGYGFASMLTSIARQIVFILPIGWLLSQLGQVNLVWYAFPIAEIGAFVISFSFLMKIYRDKIKNLQPLIK